MVNCDISKTSATTYFPTPNSSAMASCNHFQIFLFLIIPLTNALSFNFSSFPVGTQDINFEGDAFPANAAIQLTGNLRKSNMNTRFGRVSYHKPLHLWDNTTGNLTDFTTHVSFVIDSDGNSTYGDGFAFFLSPNVSTLPPLSNLTLGRTLGLAWDNQELNTSLNHFVAVEFDIFGNDFDSQRGRHVGIDINSLKSVNSTRWLCNITAGENCQAWISYNSSSHNLSVLFAGASDYSGMINYVVDLRDFLPEWVSFGFAGSTGAYFALHKILSWEFSSTAMEDDDIVAVKNSKKKSMTDLAVGLSVGAGLLICVLGLLWFIILRRKKEKNREEDEDGKVFDAYMDEELGKETGPRKFSHQELAKATKNFKEENKLGEGGFGEVYKGYLKDLNTYVAVKRVSKNSKQGIKEYAAEVKIISRLGNRNLVKLIGWCHERKELSLVYEFLPNGSLDSHLFNNKNIHFLPWGIRYKIAKGLASGLVYLQEEWEQCVVHRDIKSSNVMLDSEFNAKLGDFGLARLVDHLKGSQTTVLAGTMGYMAPECAVTGKASKESDVYSFGIVALEIACGRKPINVFAPEGQVYMVQWVWELYGRGRLVEAADQRLCGDFDEQELERLIVVGLWCAHPDESLRPSVREASRVLDSEAPLPVLPSRMPQPVYLPSGAAVAGRKGEAEGELNQSSSSYSPSTNSSW